jgi:hypothetical protein
MKELILDNPPRRRKGKSKKRRTAAQRRATAKLVASNRRKRKGRKSTKRRAKRTTVKRRRARSSTRRTVRTYKSMKRKSTRRRKACSRRRKSRTYLVRGSATPIKMNGLIGGVFSRENLMIAGGAVTGTIVANYALNNKMVVEKLGNQLKNPYIRAAALAAVPITGGILLRKYSPAIAKGMILGGLVNGIAQLITAFNFLPAGQAAPVMTANLPASSTATTSEYLGEYLGDYNDDYSDSSYLGEYLGADFSEDGSIESTGSFADSAW